MAVARGSAVQRVNSFVAMASFKGFDDDDEGPISNGLHPELDENPEARAIGIYKERRSAKVSQTGGRTNKPLIKHLLEVLILRCTFL